MALLEDPPELVALRRDPPVDRWRGCGVTDRAAGAAAGKPNDRLR